MILYTPMATIPSRSVTFAATKVKRGDEFSTMLKNFQLIEATNFTKKVNSLTSFSVPSRHVHVRKLAACSYPTFNLVQAQNQKSVKRRDKGK